MFPTGQEKSGPLYPDAAAPSEHDLSTLLVSPPPVPSSPAPAYTALPHRDVDFFLAPLLNGQVGDIELETVDGKRFLVHKKLLEQETVFFHIYYGFIPVWRLQNTTAGPPHPHFPMSQASSSTNAAGPGPLNSFFSIPKIIASHLRASVEVAETNETECPPPLPPKDIVTAPTPTNTPYTWVVPESSAILAAFLSLIYPRGTFTTSPEAPLANLEMTGRVVRAALGYQSAKALNAARDRMASFIDSQPLETYAMASFFKFTDLARLASTKAMKYPVNTWTPEIKQLIGRSGAAKLEGLQQTRLHGLREILSQQPQVDEHSTACGGRAGIEALWSRRVQEIGSSLSPDSELIELLEVDLRGSQCGDCLVLLGSTIRECLYQAKTLPKTI